MPLPGSDPKGGGSFQKWVNILGEIGKLKAEPDTDPEFAAQVEELILGYVKPQMPEGEDPMAAMMAMAQDPAAGPPGAPPGAPPGPMPVEQAATRLPRRRGNPTEQLAGIERDLSATVR